MTPKFSGIKQQTFIISVSMGEEFVNHLAGWFWLRVSYKVAVGRVAKVTVIGRLGWGQKIYIYGSL